MKTILFCATYPNQPIGYSKIANIVTNYLASLTEELQELQDSREIEDSFNTLKISKKSPKYKVYYFGFSNYPDLSIKERFILILHLLMF